MDYQDINARTIDLWVENGWEWGTPVSHDVYERAKDGEWEVLLTPVRPVPHAWFGTLEGKTVLGLACGGGQLAAGFRLTDVYGDTNGRGNLHEHHIPTFWATRAVKE